LTLPKVPQWQLALDQYGLPAKLQRSFRISAQQAVGGTAKKEDRATLH
jgi:hypothetical protein